MESTAARPSIVEDPDRPGDESFFALRAERSPAGHLPGLPSQPGDGADRSVGLRQVDAAALPQPHERPDRRRADRRAASSSTTRDPRPGHRRDRAAPQGGHGLPEADALCQVDLRERGLRAADRRRRASGRSSTRPWKRACSGPPSGTRSRTGCTNRPWGSPAASTSGCASPGRSPSTRRSSSWTSPVRRLDPRSTTRIEDLIGELRGEYTIIIVTHNLQQAARVSDHTAFLYEGELIEYGPTEAAVHQAGEEGDGRLPHRPVRMMEGPHGNFQGDSPEVVPLRARTGSHVAG